MTVDPAPRLKVLLTNLWMGGPGGTQSVTRDLALGLLRRGHRPTVYSPTLGELTQDLQAQGVAVTDDLRRIAEAPDVIHGQHYVQTGEALIHFPATAAIQHCHAFTRWEEAPVRLPQVYRYLAVDEAVRDRLAHMEGIAPARIEIAYTAVDLRRIPPARAPLPPQPRRALAFTKNRAQLPFIEEACRRRGLELAVLGAGGDRLALDPEQELARADLVFATARMALEALCAGCAVVVCDARGLAGLATDAGFADLRRLNFGLRSLTRPVTVEALLEAIDRYDPAEAEALAARARREADLELLLARLEAVYAQAVAAPRPPPQEVRSATLAFLHSALPRLTGDSRWPWMAERAAMAEQIARLEGQVGALASELLRLHRSNSQPDKSQPGA